MTVAPNTTSKQLGLKVRTSLGGEETTLIYYDGEAKKLCFDPRKSGVGGQRGLALEQALYELEEGEPLALRIIVDKSVIEVFANRRQAICRRVSPAHNDSLETENYAEGGSATFSRIRAWKMMPSNPY